MSGNMKILYLMWIDWCWIWQRPQILAGKLEQNYDVTVAFPRNIISRQRMQKSNIHPHQYRKIYVVPLYNKSNLLYKIMKLIIKWNMRNVKDFDVIWVGHPLFEEFIPADYEGKIIYDCMDNHFALSGNAKEGAQIAKLERSLAERAAIIFASSSLLRDKMQKWTEKHNTPIALVRNGYDFKELHEVANAKKSELYKLGYIGTISEWMDYSLILNSIERYHNIEYHLVGVVSGNNYIKKPGLYYEGVVEHKALYDKIKEYDCLIMPFLVNDIVLSVDPVKLYEYISFGKCIISVYYKEIERFDEFVYFYNTEQEYYTLIDELMRKGFPPKYSKDAQQKFMSRNTWDNRMETIYHYLKEL